MLAIIAPGQGAQTPGMLSTWAGDAQLEKLLRTWSDVIDLDLLHLGIGADADEIKDTANAQPLIVATSLIAAHALAVKNAAVVSGHSVGELAAAAISGAISPEDALTLVRARGIEMAKAAALHPAGMSAVLGGERKDVVAAIQSLGLVAANENGAGQIVAAGDLTALASLAENPPVGARVRALAVAGAFHTSFMAPAVEPLREIARGITTNNPGIGVISNKDGAVINDGTEILARIINQIANPVRWDLCMDSLESMGITGVIELAPAGTLVGLLKRAYPHIENFALKNADDLNAAREFAGRHA
ncbi:MAG: acyltransferase domain-containing protein [Actinobacteria bacterium]|uniref:[acyl-carrier-protein] S-malonyltransferase n=1 Tax=freshwater metagenome TaxID=449393 RepID=A0A6J6W7Y6_9ZZZZ|nr:acyltransferase domain-containing protein [Actinomycetota bacterium]MSY35903.1 acyltransferase domain-containing protein [Actinomycetota bacterium]MTA72495.1 acyltransferase domain-containing protein [Actinomycetota bacterium]MTB29751.1 acyltransferase domain-containing protein [Actinomycetota bacterium]MUH49318.1 acyltransferase domain-containing protein [Actinomycetota bacterium]